MTWKTEWGLRGVKPLPLGEFIKEGKAPLLGRLNKVREV